ncbi:hypothetical protein OG783_33720 (plasmid) [Streptomyces jietaisiensis]|uniref:hypothetical protein n=1 Tax=Streptomyces griseoaurantiacus TaxID=68213 RepID=UPI00324D1E7B
MAVRHLVFASACTCRGTLMPLGVRERVQHPAVLRGGGEFLLLGQVEHDRPVPDARPHSSGSHGLPW